MKKATLINYTPPADKEEQQPKSKIDNQIVHFYEVGEKIFMPISLYITLKFGLVNPKVLILVESL